MSRPAKITIDIAALKHNLNFIRSLTNQSSVLAMVKSNAYGHGLSRIGLALKDADALGVACLEEGTQLREQGVKNSIVLMEGLFRADELPQAVKYNFTLIVHHISQVEMLEKSVVEAPLSVWIKIDTGMHRLGFNPQDVKKIYERLINCAAVKKPVGLMTHFAQSDFVNNPFTKEQIDLFKQLTSDFPGPKSLANSGGILAWPDSHADWVRPGIMLYGASPFANTTGIELGLKPVMSFTSELIAIHQLKKGDQIGYGGFWTCPEDMNVGVVAVGYGDGYPWHAPNGTPILVNGVICPLVGRVAMDMLNVDLRAQPNAKVGDPVVLWGPSLPVEKVAAHSKTIGYELLTRIAQRVRVHVAE